MPVIEVIYDDSGNVVGVHRVESASLIQQVRDANGLIGAARAILSQNANQFKGVTIDRAVATFGIETSPVLTEDQKREALGELNKFQLGDSFKFKTATSSAIESVGDRPPPPRDLIEVFLDP